MLSKYRQKFAKSPNQNTCDQTLSKFARFPESGDKFANMATLLLVVFNKQTTAIAMQL